MTNRRTPQRRKNQKAGATSVNELAVARLVREKVMTRARAESYVAGLGKKSLVEGLLSFSKPLLMALKKCEAEHVETTDKSAAPGIKSVKAPSRRFQIKSGVEYRFHLYDRASNTDEIYMIGYRGDEVSVTKGRRGTKALTMSTIHSKKDWRAARTMVQNIIDGLIESGWKRYTNQNSLPAILPATKKRKRAAN